MNLINTQIHGDVTVVTFNTGSLDASNSDSFRKQIRPVLEKNSTIAVDMSGLQFVDSSGLGALLSCLRFSSESGGFFAIYGMQRAVAAMFELMRMQRVFSIFNNLDEVNGALQ